MALTHAKVAQLADDGTSEVGSDEWNAAHVGSAPDADLLGGQPPAAYINTGWEDLQGDVSQGTGGATLTYAAFRDTPFKILSFRNAANDELHMRYQMAHAWDPTTSVKPHVHLVPLTDPAAPQVVRFTGYYAWAQHAAEVPALAGWTAFTVDHTVQVGDVNDEDIVTLATVAPAAGAAASDILLVYLKRAGQDAADTYAGDVGVLSVDVHYQRVKAGTSTEY
jgi:hypothetical protein